MDYSQETAALIERQCRNVEREDFILNKPLSEELILQTYDLFDLPRPKKVKWVTSPLDEEYQKSARSARSADSAGSARSAWNAGSAGSAWSAWNAWSARSADSAGSARSAWNAWNAWSAGSAWNADSARSAWNALDYDFDWYVFEFEYLKNPDKEYPPNESDYKYLEYCELLMKAKEAGLGYRVEWEDTLYLAPTPLVKINALNQFHCETGPAIRWKDSKEEYYYLNAVNFPKEVFKKVTSGTMPFEEILTIEDIDQRTQAMRFGDVLKFIEHTKGKLLDQYIKHTPEGEPINYRLYRIPKGDIFTIDAYYMIYNDPSTQKQYMSGVNPCKTVAEAMSWKLSTDTHTVTPEEWQNLQPLVTES